MNLDYNHSNRNRAEEANKLAERAYQLRLDLMMFRVPDRFKESLEDLHNFLEIHWPSKK